VYDITDGESFVKVRKWVKELRKIVGVDISICIAGNKVDLERNRQVNEKEVLEYAKSVNASHFYTSAKTNVGLEECFQALANKMIGRKKEKVRGREERGAEAKSEVSCLMLLYIRNTKLLYSSLRLLA